MLKALYNFNKKRWHFININYALIHSFIKYLLSVITGQVLLWC